MSSNIFSIGAAEQDVEALLDGVAEAIARWEKGESLSLELSVTLGEVARSEQRIKQLRSQWKVDGTAIIYSSRPVLGPLIIYFQHLMRKLTWWYLEPILQQIRLFQRNAGHTVAGLAQNQKDILAQNERLGKELETLRSKVQMLEARLEDREDDA